MTHIWTTNFYGNSNIGLYAFATDEYCLIGFPLKKSIRERLEHVLKVPVHHITMCGTSLIGVFITGNKNMILVPSIAFDDELHELKRLNIKYTVIETKLTALGNNVLCNDNGCIANPDLGEETIKKIGHALKVPAVAGRIADLEIVGSVAVANSTHCLIHRDAKEHEIETVRKILNTKVETGTINMASPYIKSGIISNNHGLIVGDSSGGPEVANADEVLGHLGRHKE
ncbi:MAG: translation initiation factor IF-6 [Candidatus Woesearchaeota archaeon]|nr:translation initiation factor IF-6 [Candidatus Woesearchaeota archaeon]